MSLLRLLRKPDPSKELPEGRAPKLLIVQVAGIGDLVLTTPALDALRQRYAEARIDLLTSGRAASLLYGHPSLNDVYALDIASVKRPWTPAGWAELRRVVAPLQQVGYDGLVSLHNVASWRGALTLTLLLKALRVPLWAGRNTDGRLPLFDLELTESLRDPVPEPLTKLRVVQLLGADATPRPLSLSLTAEERKRAEELLGGEEWAAIMPGCEDPARRWPVGRFARVSEQLAARGLRVAALGGEADRMLCQQVAEASGGKSFAGELSLRESAALLARAEVAVSNNTGTMHLAAAMSTPLVALFAPGHVDRYRPWMEQSRAVVLGAEAGVQPGDMPAHVMRNALAGISVDEVVAAVDRLLAEPEGDAGNESGVGGSLDITL